MTCDDRFTLDGRTDRGDLSTPFTRAGPEVNQVVGRLDDLTIVLDQDQRIAKVAQMRERCKQPRVVARVQANRRLIEHVEDAGQSAADLAGKSDALALAAGERRRAAGQAQVIKPDVDQERQAIADFPQQVARDVLLVGIQCKVFEKSQGLTQRPAARSGRCVNPLNRTAAASSRSRAPMQPAQGTSSTIP